MAERLWGKGNDIGRDCVKVTFARFPSLHATTTVSKFTVAPEIAVYFISNGSFISDTLILVTLKPDSAHETIKSILIQSEGKTISRKLNTQGFFL